MFVSSGEIGSLESLPAFDERAADIHQEWSRPRVGATLCVDRARCTWNGLASFSPLIQTRGLGQLTIYIHLSFVTSCDPCLCCVRRMFNDVYSRLHERTSFWGYELAFRGSWAGHPGSWLDAKWLPFQTNGHFCSADFAVELCWIRFFALLMLSIQTGPRLRKSRCNNIWILMYSYDILMIS